MTLLSLAPSTTRRAPLLLCLLWLGACEQAAERDAAGAGAGASGGLAAIGGRAADVPADGAAGAGASAPADAASAAGSSGAQAAGAVANPEPAAPAALDPGSPSYEVPVMDGALARFAQYAVAPVEWTAKKGERKLEYVLPAALVGADQRLEFVGADSAGGPWTLRGPTFGTASCENVSGQIVCRETLAGVPIDVAAVAARVQTGELPPQRLEVTKVFNGDPIGILRFPAP